MLQKAGAYGEIEMMLLQHSNIQSVVYKVLKRKR